MSEKIELVMPATWHRNRAKRIGNTGAIVAAAFNPYAWTIGFEVLNGYGKGLAIGVGPVWLAVAFTRFPVTGARRSGA